MSSGDDIEAGRMTAAQSTTVIAGQIPTDGGAGFNGSFVLHVGADENEFSPLSALSGILGAGFKGGAGVTGQGGAAGGTGVIARGAEGSVDTNPGVGLEATGGRSTGSKPTETDRSPAAPGVIGTAFASSQPLSVTETGNVGVFGQGGDRIEDTRNLGGANFIVGPDFAGAGVVGRGGVNNSNNGVPNGPVQLVSGGSAGVVGISGGTKTPAPDVYPDIGVFGVSDRGAGLSGVSNSGRGAVLQSEKIAQLGLTPSLKSPAALDSAPNAGGRPGDILVTLVKNVEALGNADVAELWFCKAIAADGSTQWVKLA